MYSVWKRLATQEFFFSLRFYHDRRLIPLPSPGQHALCALIRSQRLGAVPPERGTARIFPRKWLPEGRSHSERRASGSSAYGVGTTDGSRIPAAFYSTNTIPTNR